MKTKFLEDTKTGEVFTQSQIRNTRKRTKFIELNLLYIKNRLRSFEVYTYRYIFILDKKCRLKIEEINYPSYNIGYEYKESWIPSCNQLCKLIHILKDINHSDTELVVKYMKDNYTESEIDKSNKIAVEYFKLDRSNK